MICPHCKKPISTKVPDRVKQRALELAKQGYSARDIAVKLGGAISHATVSRLLARREAP